MLLIHLKIKKKLEVVVASKRIALFSFILLIGITIYFKVNKKMNTNAITICFFNPWRNLNPGLQNTLIGSIIIPQQFQSLVTLDNEGNIIPLLAESWTVSDDFSKINFKIKQTIKFSNGDLLTGKDVIGSWKESLLQGSEQPNNSLWDVFYKVKGIENLKINGTIDGIKLKNDYEVEVEFKEPFRIALHKFSDSRFGIYKKLENKHIIGTGKLKFDASKVDIENLNLIGKDQNYSIKYFYAKNYSELSNHDSCDAFYIPDGGNLVNETISENFAIEPLENSLRSTLLLNSLNGIFKKRENRKGLQALFFKNRNKIQDVIQNKKYSRFDMQLFNVFSSGRLEEAEVEKIIQKDDIYIDNLINEIKQNKITVANDKDDKLKNTFKILGLNEYIHFIAFERTETAKQVNLGQMQADIYYSGFSTISYDPDGVYHALGRNGAITYPCVKNERMFEILESGRKLLDPKSIDLHYQEVTRIFLDEIPFLHLGFMSSLLVYRKDRLFLKDKVARNHFDFTLLNRR